MFLWLPAANWSQRHVEKGLKVQFYNGEACISIMGSDLGMNGYLHNAELMATCKLLNVPLEWFKFRCLFHIYLKLILGKMSTNSLSDIFLDLNKMACCPQCPSNLTWVSPTHLCNKIQSFCFLTNSSVIN